ncbi:MAG: haloacid dehalogenase [Promethearchaeota archaeon CR_4]|nr:MAG: haloacid dehalogenase [Candidatus Lokiarchaeota archaeon CR_4]
MSTKLVLFDIDGTLVFKQSVHVAAFLHAFHVVFGIPETKLHWTSHHGKTDLWIVDIELQKLGVSQAEINAKIPRCTEEMIKYEREHIQEDTGYVLPHVPEFLAELKRQGFLLGLVTGNLEGIARIKMEHFRLGDFFRDGIGGFGNEHRDRAELIKIALQKAKSKNGFKFNDTNGVYIGDTPLDIKAARIAGIPTIAVLTGIYKRPDFKEDTPDLFLDDFGQAVDFFSFFDQLQKREIVKNKTVDKS